MIQNAFRLPTLVTAVAAAGLAFTPASDARTPAAPANLAGTWRIQPLELYTHCILWRQTGEVRLRRATGQKAQQAGQLYVGTARFRAEQIPTGNPGCTAPRRVFDRTFSVTVREDRSDRVAMPRRKPRRWPCVVADFGFIAVPSRQQGDLPRLVGRASEIWLIKDGRISAWNPRLAAKYGLVRAAPQQP